MQQARLLLQQARSFDFSTEQEYYRLRIGGSHPVSGDCLLQR